MKRQAASQPQGNRPREAGARGATPDLPPAVRSRLSEEQRRVLECLRSAPGGLTARQLETRAACCGEVLETALSVLLERRLVTRLNTIIPSYTTRVSAPGVDDQ